jgi:exopolysaccharide biosynthesis predicted pyruvyltransferase EpsI
MHEIFDKRFDIKNKVVIYEHKNFALKGIDDSLPRIKNGSPFEDIISFLGSAELVVTNSYHGAYWATLLNRKVVVLQPFSSKFFGFRHPLMIANNFDDIKEITDIPTYPRALAESRDANLKFLEKVQKMIRLP